MNRRVTWNVLFSLKKQQQQQKKNPLYNAVCCKFVQSVQSMCFPLTESLNSVVYITKTCVYNFDALKPHFYIVKRVYRGIHYFSYFCPKTLIVGTRYNRFAEAVLTNTHNLCFEQKYEKYQNCFIWKFSFLVVKFSIYLNRHVFVMYGQTLKVLIRPSGFAGWAGQSPFAYGTEVLYTVSLLLSIKDNPPCDAFLFPELYETVHQTTSEEAQKTVAQWVTPVHPTALQIVMLFSAEVHIV